jgi:hypothetical protein
MKAFPYTDKHNNYVQQGMDLRDYFASQAMQAILTNSDAYFTKIRELANKRNLDADKVMAGIAYVYADAMMEARKNNGIS